MTDPAHDPYQDLYDTAPCGMLSVGADGDVLGVNRTLLDWIGRESADVVGERFTRLLPAADQLFYETRVAPVLHLKGEVREVALTMTTSTGTIPILVNLRVTGSELRVAVFDATERQGYERALLTAQRAAEVSETRVRILQESAAEFTSATTESEIADRLVVSARHAMRATACAVMLADETGATTLTAGEHPLAALAADPAVREEILRLRTAGIVLVDSLDDARTRFPAFVSGMIAARIEAFSIVPIEGTSGILGALLCFFGRARALTAEEVDLQVTLARVAAQVLVRFRLQEELRALALHDQLTGVANRRLLREHLIQGMAAASRRETPIAMLLLDLDGFKSVNDERGHQQGDALLKWVAREVSEAVRTDDVVGRFGGDEFVVICHDADEEVARSVAERMRAAISGYPEKLPGGAPLTASVGIAICEPERASERPEDFFAVADAALYRSKREGKNRVSVGSL